MFCKPFFMVSKKTQFHEEYTATYTHKDLKDCIGVFNQPLFNNK